MWRLLRILGDLGRIIRATGSRRGTPPNCHPACPLPDLSPALYDVQKLSGWLTDVHRCTVCAQRRRTGTLVARHPVVHLCRGMVHALSGGAVLNGLVMLAFILDLREKGLGLDEAIQTSALTR